MGKCETLSLSNVSILLDQETIPAKTKNSFAIFLVKLSGIGLRSLPVTGGLFQAINVVCIPACDEFKEIVFDLRDEILRVGQRPWRRDHDRFDGRI